MIRAGEDISEDEGKLLNDAKNYLDITYEDADSDRKLLGVLRRGMDRLDTISGRAQDYSQEGAPRGLLFDYCRYAMSNQTEAFEENYRSQLNSLMMMGEAEDYAGDQV